MTVPLAAAVRYAHRAQNLSGQADTDVMERIKKGGVLHVDQGARRRSWAVLAQDFSK
jgi:hypothetical protein